MIGLPLPPRPLHPQPGPLPPLHHPHGGGPWDRPYRPGEEHPPPRMQAAPYPPTAAAPPVYSAPVLYPPLPPQIYPPPYATGPGLLPPPPVGYQPHPHPQPQPIYPMQGEEFYRQHHLHKHHPPDEATSKLDEFTKDFHKELMKYRNPPKRRRRSYSRSRSFSRSPLSRSPFSRSRSRSYSYTPSRSRSRSRNRSYPRSPFSRRYGRSHSRSRSRLSPGGGRKPPPREPPPAPPFDGRDPSPGTHERWERDGYRQWERNYRDYYKYYRDCDGQQPALHDRPRGSRDRERDRLSPPPRDYSPHGKSRRGRDADRGAPSLPQPSSSSSGSKTSGKTSKSKKVKKKKSVDEAEASHQSTDRGDATPVRDEPMDGAPSLTKTPASAKSTPAAKTVTAKSSSAAGKTPTKSGKTQSEKSKKDKTSKVKVKVKAESAKVKSEKPKKLVADGALAKKKEASSSAAVPSKPSRATKAPLPEESITPADTPRPAHEVHGGRDLLKSAGLRPLPMQHGLQMMAHHPSLPMDKRRRPGEERPPFPGLPPGKLRRIGGPLPVMGGDRLPPPQIIVPAHLRVPPPMDRPGSLPTTTAGRGDVGQRDAATRGDIRPLMDLQVKPMAPRRIKLNRDLGVKNSTEGPSSDKAPAGPEKTSSSTDKASSGNVPTGERPPRGPEVAGRRERSVSRERGGSRERPAGSGRERDRAMGLDRERERVPGSERDRITGSDRDLGMDRERDRMSRSDRDRDRVSDRDRDRISGSDRDRDRLFGSDRERDRIPGSDRERDRIPGSDKGRERAPGSGKERDRAHGPDREQGPSSDSDRHREKASAPAAERMAVTVERDASEGQRSVKTHKSDPGVGIARSVSLDKMTIGERSAISKKPAEQAEKTRRPSKETDGEAVEKGPKTDRGVSKDRAERTGSSGEKPAAAHRDAGKGSDASAEKSRSKVNRKALGPVSGSRPAEGTMPDPDQNQKAGSSKESDPQPQSPTPEPSPAPVEDLIQPPPRSKWERDDEEEWPENGLAALAEKGVGKVASPARGREKEKHLEAPKPIKSQARDGPKEEKKGVAKEVKAATSTGKDVRQEGKGLKTSQTAKSKAPREESRGQGRPDVRGGEREEAKGVAVKEERAMVGAGREDSRGPEPRRQRLCSDLGRETDEAAFVPDYSEAEGSEPEKGGSATPSHSTAHSNGSGSLVTAEKKKKKKHKTHKTHKTHKKHKKHKKHSGSTQDGTEEEHKQKHKKKKSKKSKEAEPPENKTAQD
ncbi:hypothetical protein NHX12_017914 [Muraenolepis orangiensis]|uniref:Uncharacterized protein n=1 Tax=Muraenolepis orangiensis TaxID=630683 RepID=A0A9Q0EVS5_9TELE|nr:hypothetical protein NHX12_017914 [Muraenolepis orangiensis]